MIRAQVLTADAFAPFGDVLDASGAPDKMINAGRCGRHHDRARLDFSDGRAGISIFDGAARSFPYTLDLMERHPAGSQAFLPMNGVPLLVCVAPDDGGRPGPVEAFLTAQQGVNLLRGTWHGVLAPIGARGIYGVVDRIGAGDNLEEFPLTPPLVIQAPA